MDTKPDCNRPDHEATLRTSDGRYDPRLHAPVEIGEINSMEHTARIFSVSRKVIYNLVNSGKLAATPIGGSSVFTRQSILDYVEANVRAVKTPLARPEPPLGPFDSDGGVVIRRRPRQVR